MMAGKRTKGLRVVVTVNAAHARQLEEMAGKLAVPVSDLVKAAVAGYLAGSGPRIYEVPEEAQ